MSRINTLNRRYAASASLVRSGIQIVAVGDPTGARFNTVVRRLVAAMRDDGLGLWDDLVGVAKLLRWRLITQPQPIQFNPGIVHLAGEVAHHARRLRGAVADQGLLDELEASAAGVVAADSVVGATLLRDCRELGIGDCVVIAANMRAQAALDIWLREHDILVLTPGEVEREQLERDHAYVVGPPRFYRSSLVTAPLTSGVSFVMPAWFSDRTVPSSAIAAYAEGAVRVKPRVFIEGDTAETLVDASAEVADEDLCLPHPVWRTRKLDDREPTTDEVEARKVLLSGNLAMWLDDGERIRSLDPEQPVGERVTYTDVAAVREGTYLLLRKGVTEHGVLYRAALTNLGPRAEAVDSAQRDWKRLLSQRVDERGYRRVVNELRAVGVKTADRARAWTNPNLIRPNSDQDFELLLRWLGIPIQPTFGFASQLRKMLYQASTEIGKQLEAAVSAADLAELEASGHLSLDVTTEGFRGILATRVLGISPYAEVVPRHETRVPFEDRGGQWLE